MRWVCLLVLAGCGAGSANMKSAAPPQAAADLPAGPPGTCAVGIEVRSSLSKEKDPQGDLLVANVKLLGVEPSDYMTGLDGRMFTHAKSTPVRIEVAHFAETKSVDFNPSQCGHSLRILVP